MSGCEICRDVVAAAEVLRAEFDAAVAEAHVPGSGLVWWRVQRRAHADAVREAARPVRSAHLVAIASACVAVLVLGWFSIEWLRVKLASVGTLAPSLTVGTEVFDPSAPLFKIGIVLAVLAAVVAPLAIYVMIEDD